MTRYVAGENVNVANRANEGKEWGRGTDIAYVVQDGPLKNLGMKVRNATVRSNVGSDLNETPSNRQLHIAALVTARRNTRTASSLIFYRAMAANADQLSRH